MDQKKMYTFQLPREQAKAMPTMPPPTIAMSYWGTLFFEPCSFQSSYNR